MLYLNQHPDQSCSRIESLLHRIMAECEGFGARYQYSPPNDVRRRGVHRDPTVQILL